MNLEKKILENANLIVNECFGEGATISIKTFNFVVSALEEVREQTEKEIMEKINQLIVDEILICHKENTPTSRLTSLIMNIKNL